MLLVQLSRVFFSSFSLKKKNTKYENEGIAHGNKQTWWCTIPFHSSDVMYFFLHEIDTMKFTQKEAHEVQLPYLLTGKFVQGSFSFKYILILV